jgi:hypothetical protein
MAIAERHTSRLTFFGRLADDLTRRTVTAADVSVTLVEGDISALQKDDGHFAFADTEPSSTDYHIRVTGGAYETRVFASKLLATTPKPITFEGEDEVYVVIATIVNAPKRVTFASIPFLPPIDAGASVVGEGGFTAKLGEPIGGQTVQSVVLDSIGGLNPGQLLRISRSSNLLLRAGPYASFSSAHTVIALRIAENTSDEAPIPGAVVTVTELNGAAPTNVSVGSVTLRNFAVGGGTLVLDDLHRTTASNDRGDAVLYFPGEAALTSARLDVSHAQFQTTSVTFAVTAKSRTFTKVLLTKV